MRSKFATIIIILLANIANSYAQGFRLSGHVVDEKKQPIALASILIQDNGLWAVTDNHGAYIINNVPAGKMVLTVRCLGYATTDVNINVTKSVSNFDITLKDDNLKLNEVQVVAQRSDRSSTTAYTIDRQALDNQQIINIANITSLLPGGKVTNPSLTSDPRIALHAGSSEAGNAAFGTAQRGIRYRHRRGWHPAEQQCRHRRDLVGQHPSALSF